MRGDGQTKSLSLGGLSMEFAEDIPAMLNQQILLSVTPGATRPESVGDCVRDPRFRKCPWFRSDEKRGDTRRSVCAVEPWR
jgi:hypothetical protein